MAINLENVRFASELTVDPISGDFNRIELPSDWKDTGLPYRKILARQIVNQIQYANYKAFEEVQQELNLLSDSTNVGKISKYLGLGLTFAEALVQACTENKVVDFEGLTLSTDVEIIIPSNALCKRWLLNGATITFTSSSLRFNNVMEVIDLGGGVIRGGLKLAKVAQDGGFDTNQIVVEDASEFSVGDIINSSLDIVYLPNSVTRQGYIEEGDFNRVANINGNTITTTYTFLRKSTIPDVDTGLIKGAYVANGVFDKSGILFAAQEQHPTIVNGTLDRFQGYFLNIDDGVGDLRKSTLTIKDVNITNSFLDIVRFRGKGLILDNVKVTRQYDLAKQFLVVDTPVETGFVIFKNGCDVRRQNYDAEIYMALGGGVDGYSECGIIVIDDTCYFEGTKPSDLPLSDIDGGGGQVYFGYNVPIRNSLYFYTCSTSNNRTKGMIVGASKFVNYERHLFGTTYARALNFSFDILMFTGTESSCDPVYIDVTEGNPLNNRTFDNDVTIINGKFQARRQQNFGRGCLINAYNTHFFVNDSDISNASLNGFVSADNLKMEGGKLEGRWRVSQSRASFKEVYLPYRGSANSTLNPIFSNGYMPNPEDTHFILGVPYDDDFEGSGNSLLDYDGRLPLTAWFSVNNDVNVTAPPSYKFAVQNCDGLYKVGGYQGFSNPYTHILYRGNSSYAPATTSGKFSGKLSKGDIIVSAADNVSSRVYSALEGITGQASVVGDNSIVVGLDPEYNVDFLGVWHSDIKAWIYYPVKSKSTNTYTLNKNVVRDIPLGAPIVQVKLMSKPSAVPSGFGVRLFSDGDFYGNISTAFNMRFSSISYDDSGNVFSQTANRITIPNELDGDRVDVSAYAEFEAPVDAGVAFHLRVIHYDRNNVRKGIVAATSMEIGYNDHRVSISGLGIPVNKEDYFVVSIRCNDTTVNLQQGWFVLRKS